jgi:hypothetical protein
MSEVCTICAVPGVRGDRGCSYIACRGCCITVQGAQMVNCDLADHGRGGRGDDESTAGSSSTVSRTDVVFPDGVDRLNVTNKYLLFCPHSFVHHHLRTRRGNELLDDKLRYLQLEVDRPRGKQGKKGAGCDSRDMYECRVVQEVINELLRDERVPTEVLIHHLAVPLRRLYELMILKNTGGLALLRKFDEVNAAELLPSALRRATALAKRPSTSTAGSPAPVRRVTAAVTTATSRRTTTRSTDHRRQTAAAASARDDDDDDAAASARDDDEDDTASDLLTQRAPVRRSSAASATGLRSAIRIGSGAATSPATTGTSRTPTPSGAVTATASTTQLTTSGARGAPTASAVRTTTPSTSSGNAPARRSRGDRRANAADTAVI